MLLIPAIVLFNSLAIDPSVSSRFAGSTSGVAFSDVTRIRTASAEMIFSHTYQDVTILAIDNSWTFHGFYVENDEPDSYTFYLDSLNTDLSIVTEWSFSNAGAKFIHSVHHGDENPKVSKSKIDIDSFNTFLAGSTVETEAVSYLISNDNPEALPVLLALAGAACIANQIACYNDVNSALANGYATCETTYSNSACIAACRVCVWNASEEDRFNCLITCGQNGPDGDLDLCANPPCNPPSILHIPDVHSGIGVE